MAINNFHTLFDARERKVQTEKIYQGEAVDLVAKITNDGVVSDLTGYTATGYYQPTSYVGTDNASVFYSVNAEISNGEVIVHWTPDKDFNEGPYQIWALLTKTGDESYPVCWKLNLAHSPGYPAGETPQPIPQYLDFNDYTLLNAPWLPLAGGTCTGDVTVSANLTANKVVSNDIKVNADKGITQVFIGSDAGSNQSLGGGVAIGYNAKCNSMGTAIGTGADLGGANGGGGTLAIGFSAKATGMQAVSLGNDVEASGAVSNVMGAGSKATSVGAMAFGYSAYAQAKNAIQIGTYADEYSGGSIGTTPCYNTTANSVQFFQHQVFQTTGNPTSNPSTSNLVLVRERAPWAISFSDVAGVSRLLVDADLPTVIAKVNELIGILGGTNS